MIEVPCSVPRLNGFTVEQVDGLTDDIEDESKIVLKEGCSTEVGKTDKSEQQASHLVGLPGGEKSKQKEPRNYFSLINNHTKEEDKIQEFLQTSRCNDGKKYILLLLNFLSKKTSDNSAIFICEDGQVVSIPLPVLSLAWPHLANIVQESSCCSEVSVSVPCSAKVMTHVKELMCQGSCLDLTSCDERLLLSFIKVAGINWSIARQLRFENEDDVYIGDLYEDEPGECDENEEVKNVLIDKAWPSKVQLKSMRRKKLCSPSCRNDCYKVTETWSADQTKIVKDIFKCEKVVSVKNKMMNHLKVQGDVGEATDSFVILGHQFCLEFLSSMTGCSVYLLKTVLEDYWRQVRCYDNGNKGIIKNQSNATVIFISWFKNFLALYGQDAPDAQVVILNHWLKGKVLFKMYQEEAPGPHIKLSTFYSHLKTYFGPKRVDRTLPCHRISAYTSHSVCDLCVALNAHRKLSKTEAERNLANSLFNQHKMDFGMARRSVNEIRQTALDYPHDVLFIQSDGMDNSKSYLPRFMENSKKLVGTERLPSKISGCIIWSGLYKEKRKDIFFINHDHFGLYYISCLFPLL